MKHKAIALVVVAALSGGSAATFASQDSVFRGMDSGTSQVVGQAETPSAESIAVEEATATPTDTATATPTDTATPTPADTASPTATNTATPTVTNTATPTPGEGQRDVVGIPDSNPSKHPENGDGVCDKGETVIKIVPSGKQVNVPCQAVKPHGPKSHDNEPTPTPTPTEQP
jgi:hypothetical protein